MSAVEIIEQIKDLSPAERQQIARFVSEIGTTTARQNVSITIGSDGLPVISVSGGKITSQLVHEIESRTP